MVLQIFPRIFSRLFDRTSHDTPASQIYGSVVTQSRIETFFTQYNIPDTVIGRYDMLALHVFLINHRLKTARKSSQTSQIDTETAELSQLVFDLFLDDLERGLRDLGFADTSVHKRKKRLTRSYYALIDEFDTPIENNDIEPLAKAVQARYFSDQTSNEDGYGGRELAQYILNTTKHLEAQSPLDLLKGKLDWLTNIGEMK